MTLPRQTNSNLNKEEWQELEALKDALDYDVRQVHPDKMEKFTEYLVRTLRERGG
jgi:hypothetical protein